MKCDELKDRWFWAYPTESVDCDGITGSAHEVYGKSDVDAAIAELKDKLQLDEDEMAGFLQLEEECGGGDLRNYIAELKAENRRLQRALWIAMAKRAIEKIAWFKLWNACISTMNPEDGARQEFDKWKKNLGKFLKKAEEYK